MLVTSLMPDSRAAIFDARGSAGGGAVRRGVGRWRRVVCGAPGERRHARPEVARAGAQTSTCGGGGVVGPAPSSRVWRLVGPPRVLAGAPAMTPGEWGVRPVRTRRVPQTAAPGPRSGQRAARGCRATFDHATPRSGVLSYATDATAAQGNRWFRASPILRWRGFSGAPVSSASAGE